MCLSMFLRIQLDEGFDNVLLLTTMHTEVTVRVENGFTSAHPRCISGSLAGA